MPLVFIVFVFIVINYFVHFWSSDTFFVMASGGSGKVTPQGRGSRRLTLQGLVGRCGNLIEVRKWKQIVKRKGSPSFLAASSRRERGDVEGAQGLEVLVTKYIVTRRTSSQSDLDVGSL